MGSGRYCHPPAARHCGKPPPARARRGSMMLITSMSIAADLIELELTERSLMEDTDSTVRSCPTYTRAAMPRQSAARFSRSLTGFRSTPLQRVSRRSSSSPS